MMVERGGKSGRARRGKVGRKGRVARARGRGDEEGRRGRVPEVWEGSQGRPPHLVLGQELLLDVGEALVVVLLLQLGHVAPAGHRLLLELDLEEIALAGKGDQGQVRGEEGARDEGDD